MIKPCENNYLIMNGINTSCCFELKLGTCTCFIGKKRNHMILFLLLVAIIALLYLLSLKTYSYWDKRNVQTGEIKRVFKDNLNVLLGMESFANLTQRMYNSVKDVRYLGVYQFHMPLLVAKSPEIIKKICVKDFEHFLNHRTVIPDGIDEFWSKNLFSLTGQTWKNMRSTVSPSFTSSKMKAMFVLICENAEQFVQYFSKKKEEIIEVEFKDAFTRFTSDVIASAVFGIQIDSLGNTENEFYLMGKNALDCASVTMKCKLLFYLMAPKLAAYFRIKLFKEKITNFFLQVVKDTIKMRLEQNIKRPDMLGMLMEMRETQKDSDASSAVKEHLEIKDIKQNLTDTDIATQVFIFFLAGLDNVSTQMSFMAYELAVNPDVQRRLIEEIDENTGKSQPLYDTISTMTYLDMVVSETLRKWPFAIATDRMVTKPYTIQPETPDEKPVFLDIDDTIMIPIYAIHHDPQYYPDPEKFDPDRFSPENRSTINPYAYLPFGIGPRNCIGSRFALLEIKAVFFYILKHFEIVPVQKTRIPLQIKKKSYNLTSEDGFYLGLKRRIRT